MEDGIKEYLNFLIYRGHQGTHKDIRLAANLILEKAGSTRRVTSNRGCGGLKGTAISSRRYVRRR
jgi:hypothetical protein